MRVLSAQAKRGKEKRNKEKTPTISFLVLLISSSFFLLFPLSCFFPLFGRTHWNSKKKYITMTPTPSLFSFVPLLLSFCFLFLFISSAPFPSFPSPYIPWKCQSRATIFLLGVHLLEEEQIYMEVGYFLHPWKEERCWFLFNREEREYWEIGEGRLYTNFKSSVNFRVTISM